MARVVASATDNKPHWSARIGVFGDLPGRLVTHSLRVVPWFMEPVLIAGWTSLVFLAAGTQRRAVAGNLRAMHPQWGIARATLGAWRVFWNFAVTYVDGLRCETGTGDFDWEIAGASHLEELANRSDGCILLTAHMGSYDIAAPMFSSRLKRTLHTVRAPEREAEVQRLREMEIQRQQERHPNFRTHYNRGDNMLGVELSRLLTAGDIVAVQADRVVFDVSPMTVELDDGLRIRMPKGPLVLAQVNRAPCYPVFIIRTGWRRYRIDCHPPFELPPRGRDDGAIAKTWAEAVFLTLRRHWDQWFVFEPALSRDRQ